MYPRQQRFVGLIPSSLYVSILLLLLVVVVVVLLVVYVYVYVLDV